MRIAIPVRGDDVFSPMSGAEAFHFYEDDHGRIIRQFLVPLHQPGLEGAIALMAQYGIDALICGEVSDEELAERLGHIKRPAHPAPGVLGAYRKAVDSVNEGCTWLYGKEE